MNLFRFELNKYLNLKTLLLLLAVIIGITSFFFIRNILFQTAVTIEESKEIEGHLQSTYQAINEHREELKINSDDEKGQQLLDISLSMRDEIFSLRSAHNQSDWKEKLTSENRFFQLVEDYQENGGNFPISEEKLSESQAFNQRLLSKNISPQLNTYSLATPNFIKELADWYFIIGIPLLMLFFVGGIMTNEYERHTIRFMFTQPFSRASLILTKGIIGLLLYSAIIVCAFLVSYIISNYFGHTGTFDYPVLIHQGEEISFITISEYLWTSFILLSVTVLMCLSFYLFLSLLVKHTLGTIILFVMTLIIGRIINDWIPNVEFGWLNPFRNLFINESIINQSVNDWYVGIPIALVVAIGFIFLSYKMLTTQKFSKSS